MVLTAGGHAGVVAAAVFGALNNPSLADVEGQGLRELGDVGGDAVFADAAVGQGILGVYVSLGFSQVLGLLRSGREGWPIVLRTSRVLQVSLSSIAGLSSLWGGLVGLTGSQSFSAVVREVTPSCWVQMSGH